MDYRALNFGKMSSHVCWIDSNFFSYFIIVISSQEDLIQMQILRPLKQSTN